MSRRQFVYFSLFNAILLIASISFYFLGRQSPPVPRTVLKYQPSSNALAKIKAPPPRLNITNIVIYTNAFHWSQLESPDYRQFIRNLRAVGCPEMTIKDIILTDIMKSYAEKRGQFYHTGREFRFWETEDKLSLTQKQLIEREKNLALIDKEVPTILRELLGLNYERELNKYFVDSQQDERRLSFLPAEKSARILELRDQIETEKELMLASFTNDPPAQIQSWLASMDKKHEDELKSLLSPNEYEEFRLRTSDTASWLRQRLVGFNPTEDEFRTIFAEAEKRRTELGMKNNEASPEALAGLENAIKNVLAPSRVVDFEKTRNRDYQDIYRLAARFELPDKAAEEVLSIKAIVEQEKGNLLRQRLYSQEKRAQMLEAIRSETEITLKQALGGEAFSAYLQESGQWLKGLPNDPVTIQERISVLAPELIETEPEGNEP